MNKIPTTPTITLTLVSIPVSQRDDTAPDDVRLARLLKAALRVYGFRVVDIKQGVGDL